MTPGQTPPDPRQEHPPPPDPREEHPHLYPPPISPPPPRGLKDSWGVGRIRTGCSRPPVGVPWESSWPPDAPAPAPRTHAPTCICQRCVWRHRIGVQAHRSQRKLFGMTRVPKVENRQVKLRMFEHLHKGLGGGGGYEGDLFRRMGRWCGWRDWRIAVAVGVGSKCTAPRSPGALFGSESTWGTCCALSALGRCGWRTPPGPLAHGGEPCGVGGLRYASHRHLSPYSAILLYIYRYTPTPSP